MASLTKRRKSPYWVACYSTSSGKRLQRSTKLRDKSKAMQVAIKLEDGARRKIAADQARKLAMEISEIIHGTVVSNESCADYFSRWRERRKHEVTERSDLRFGEVIKRFLDFLGDGKNSPIMEISTAKISLWRDDLAANLSPKTVNVALKVIKQAFRDAWIEGIVAESPAEKIKLMRIRNGDGEKKVFTPEQYRALISFADGEWKGMIIAAAFTGQRLSDIACMRTSEIAGGWWRFGSRKTGFRTALPLAREFLDWYAEWIPSRKIASEYVFPESGLVAKNSGGRVGTLSNRFHRLMVAAGIVSRRPSTGIGVGRSGRRKQSEYSFHSFRHTCTTWLKASGVSESVAMEFVGHESKAVNRNYTHIPEDSLVAAMRKMEKFSELAA